MPSKRTRRRGRAAHPSDSEDDEIERAAQTDSDDSNDSEDDSDSDSNSEPVSRRLTPNTSHSPDADEKPVATWADMVDELDTKAVVRKVLIAAPRPDSTDDEPERDHNGQERDRDDHDQPVASSSRHSPAPPDFRSPRSQSARQAYQHRLESDPSFVPVVGEFWGHDDRLLDKDLRSLSGWWRGRWQGRGRPRGSFPPRSRGRGGFFGPGRSSATVPDAEPVAESPIDRAWTHDGYEEMQRRREETRARPPIPRGGRIWFTMKPEHMWTKQHDAFLYFDPALKPRPGQPAGVRVRLPGGGATIVRAIPRPNRPSKAISKPAAADIDYVVRLPRAGKGKATSPMEDEAFTVKLPPQPVPVPLSPPVNPLQPDADGWVQPTPAAVALAIAASPPPGPPSALPIQAQIQLSAAPPPFFPFAPPPGFGFSPGPTNSHRSPPGFSTHTPPPPGFSTPPPPPAFGTPPPFNAPLPPGVALDARGMPFEVASGRPVVLQGPPPVMYPNAYGHHHSHSMSIGHAHSMSMSHTPSMDPTLFAFARPARVEIRAPGAAPAAASSPQSTPQTGPTSPPARAQPLSPRKDPAIVVAQPSLKLRTNAAAFVPSHAASPSVSASADPTAAYFANGYTGGGSGAVNGYEANGNAYEGAYDGYGGGGYAQPPGTTYYYPYYAPAPAADGTVYYQ
ncbi:Btz domain-containing protein [Mycena sanguinolenta]|uniref:Btz domain-containing protein n=1 Tax=Mycena sanguinolenta TaxID=230812 RepID=A0A8H7CYV3_9AGAR|nr:Btz domain-containing protein [Mycena sanguinolenta]